MATTLDTAIVLDYLQAFSNQENFWDLLMVSFGENTDRARAAELRAQWQTGDFSHLPPVIITDELGAASGGYAASTDTIYLSQSLLDSGDPAQIVVVLLEQIGHSINAQINTADALGDEGAIFSALVWGESLSAAALATSATSPASRNKSTQGQYLLLLEETKLSTFSIASLELLGLTKREAEVLYWVSQDKNNTQIAEILGNSEGTVRKQLENIYKKLKVHTRAGAIIAALKKLGILYQ